jgi:hypothetical protein
VTRAQRVDRRSASPYGLGSATTGARHHYQPSGKMPTTSQPTRRWGHFRPPRRGHCSLPLRDAGSNGSHTSQGARPLHPAVVGRAGALAREPSVPPSTIGKAARCRNVMRAVSHNDSILSSDVHHKPKPSGRGTLGRQPAWSRAGVAVPERGPARSLDAAATWQPEALVVSASALGVFRRSVERRALSASEPGPRMIVCTP